MNTKVSAPLGFIAAMIRTKAENTAMDYQNSGDAEQWQSFENDILDILKEMLEPNP